MNERTPPQVFLERQTYRRRRLMDAARLLPALGALLMMVPLLWPQSGSQSGSIPASGPNAEMGTQGVPISDAIIYVFSVWAGLIILSALFGHLSRQWGGLDGPQAPTDRRDTDIAPGANNTPDVG